MTTTMAKKRQLGTQEDDHDHDNGQEERNQEHKKIRMTTVMAMKSVTKNTRRGSWRWPRKGNHEHKRITVAMVMARNNATKYARGQPQQWLKIMQPRMQEDNHGDG